jgi:hypothetical protein
MRISTIVGKDNLIRTKLEEGYSFRLLSRELGVSYQTLINYVRGLDRHCRRKRPGIGFTRPSTTRDWAERHGVSPAPLEIGCNEGVSGEGK